MEVNTMAERLRRQEILRFPFESYESFLKKLLRAPYCKPEMRRSILHFLDIIAKKERTSTETLEKVKYRILALETKISASRKEVPSQAVEERKFVPERWVPQKVHTSTESDRSHNSTSNRSKQVSKPKLDGPEEISNCPDIKLKRMHVYKPENKFIHRQNNMKNLINGQAPNVKTSFEPIQIKLGRSSPLNLTRDEVWHYDVGDDIRKLAGVKDEIKISETTQSEAETSRQSGRMSPDLLSLTSAIDRLCGQSESSEIPSTSANSMSCETAANTQLNLINKEADIEKKKAIYEKILGGKGRILKKIANDTNVAVPSMTAHPNDPRIQGRQEVFTNNNNETSIENSKDPVVQTENFVRRSTSVENSKDPVVETDSSVNRSTIDTKKIEPKRNSTTKRSETQSKTSKTDGKSKPKEVYSKSDSGSKTIKSKPGKAHTSKPNPTDKRTVLDPENNKTIHLEQTECENSSNSISKSKSTHSSAKSKQSSSNSELKNKPSSSKVSKSTVKHKNDSQPGSSKTSSVSSDKIKLKTSKPNTNSTTASVSPDEKEKQSSDRNQESNNENEKNMLEQSQEDSSDEDSQFQRQTVHISLELCDTQHHRYEKRRGRGARGPVRRSNRVTKHHRVKLEPPEFIAEPPVPNPTENAETTLVRETEERSESPARILETPVTPSVPVSNNEPVVPPPTDESQVLISDEMDEIKREIFETEYEVENIPVQENTDEPGDSQETFLDEQQIKNENHDSSYEGIASSLTIEDTTGVVKEETFNGDDIEEFPVIDNPQPAPVAIQIPDVPQPPPDAIQNPDVIQPAPDAIQIPEVPQPPPVVVKLEPISFTEIEADFKIERIKNFAFVNHPISFQFRCLICDYITNDRSLFMEHILSVHNHIEWDGFCTQCDTHVTGDDKPLKYEFQHMLTVHVKGNDLISLDTDIANYRPPLKLRRLDGDTLSNGFF